MTNYNQSPLCPDCYTCGIYLHLCIYSRLIGNNLSEEAEDYVECLLPYKVNVMV